MVLWDCAVLPYPFDFDTCIKVKLDSSWRIHTNFPTLKFKFSVGRLGSTDTKLVLHLKLDLTSLTVYVYSLNLEFGRGALVVFLRKVNSSTIGTMRRTAITVCYLQMLCLLVVLLLSSKSRFSCWGACLLSSKSCFMLCYLLLASSKVYFVGSLDL